MVIIARNEECTISRCISSGIESLELAISEGRAQAGEVVFVDSASTDRTVEEAKSYPVTILQLKDGWPLSAAAGRQIGLENSKGDLILFVDGDTVLQPTWLPKALGFIDQPLVAAVGGTIEESSRGDSVLARRILDQERSEAAIGVIQETEVVNVGLYRREILESIGGFHPFLKGSEDLDLGLRLRAKGWRLLRTGTVSARHYWSPGREDITFVEYLRSVAWWSYGAGQAYRYRFHDIQVRRGLVLKYVSARYVMEYLRGLTPAAWVLAHAILVLKIPGILPGIILIDAILGAVVNHLRTRSNKSWREFLFTFHGLLYSVTRHGGFLLGLFARIRRPEDYPRPPSVVRVGSEWGRRVALVQDPGRRD